VTTFYLYAMMALLLLVSGIPEAISGSLIGIGIALLLWSFISYLLKFNQMVREAK
jgi:phosphatidylglycerophosphate synthase